MFQLIQKTLSEILSVKPIGYEVRGDYVIYKFSTTSFSLSPSSITKLKVALLQALNPPFDIPTEIDVIPIRKGPLFSHVEVHVKIKRRMIDASPKTIESKIKRPINKIKSLIREEDTNTKGEKIENKRKVIILNFEEGESSKDSFVITTKNNKRRVMGGHNSENSCIINSFNSSEETNRKDDNEDDIEEVKE